MKGVAVIVATQFRVMDASDGEGLNTRAYSLLQYQLEGIRYRGFNFPRDVTLVPT